MEKKREEEEGEEAAAAKGEEEDEEEDVEEEKAGKPWKTSLAKELAIFSVRETCLRCKCPRPRSERKQLIGMKGNRGGG